MRRGRIAATCGALAAAAFIAVPGAGAATPAQIYKDYADNGRLDGNYSQADMQRALKDTLLQGYHGQSQGGLEAAVQSKKPPASKGDVAAAPVTQSTLPFTGLDLGLLVAGGLGLLLLGAVLRRAARSRA